MGQNCDKHHEDKSESMLTHLHKKFRSIANFAQVTGSCEEDPGYWRGVITLSHLPTEVLEIIVQELSYHDMRQLRQSCRRFRDIVNRILNRDFCSLEERVQKHLNAITDEVQYQFLNPPPYIKPLDTNRDLDGKFTDLSLEGKLLLIRYEWMLNVIIMQLRLLRAICYRFFFLNEISESIHYPSTFFAGEIIDEIHRMLRLVDLKTIKENPGSIYQSDTFAGMVIDEIHRMNGSVNTPRMEQVLDTSKLHHLVDAFIDFFHYRIEPLLIANEAVVNRETLFGCKIIDLLECCLDCDKSVTVSLDSEGWCHIKGEYTFNNTFFTCFSINNRGFEDLEPLTVEEQRSLHECLRHLINRSNQCYLKELMADGHMVVNDLDGPLSCGSYVGLAKSDNYLYYYSYFNLPGFTMMNVDWFELLFGHLSVNYREPELKIKVNMKCRKELAPVEVLRKWIDNSPDETEPCEAETSGEDLVLRMEIDCSAAELDDNRLPTVYRCLIKQRYLPEEPPTGPDEEVVLVPLDNSCKPSDIILCDDVQLTTF